jgi:Flp pilus assembly protein TadG
MIALRAKVATMRTRLARCFTAFRRDRSGVSALEFAFVLPLMLTIYIGSFELSQGLSAKTKVSQTARTITDLVSRWATTSSSCAPTPTPCILTSQMSDIFQATNTIMSPFTITNAQFVLVVSTININANGNATIGQSCASDGNTYYTPGETITTVPAALIIPNTAQQLVWGTASYTYSPFLVRGGAPFYTMVGPVTLADQMYMSPRNSQYVYFQPC